MKSRNLFAVALGLALAANAAVANEWGFDDPYWKRSETVAAQTQSAGAQGEAQQGKYDLVDRFNP
jgi:hypothetical protein